MRGWTACLVILAIAGMLVPPVHAADEGVFVADAAGDVSYRPAGSAVAPAPAATHGFLDIRRVWLSNETRDTVEVGVKLQQWDQVGGASAPVQRIIGISFSVGELQYILTFPGVHCKDDEARLATLNLGSQRPSCLKASIEPTQAIFRVVLPKTLLTDSRFVPLQIGYTIANLRARAVGNANGSDLAPDQGNGPDYVVRLGVGAQRGDLMLRADQPIRASNGEATTLLYKMTLVNNGPTQRTVLLTVDSAYADWAIRAPARVVVDSGKDVSFPVIVAMNFTHQHGTTEFFSVTVEDVHDPAHGATATLGVRWLDIPQPAGHHDRLWLHSRPSTYEANGLRSSDVGLMESWFNAQEEDATPGTTDAAFPPKERYGAASWVIPLSPKLEIGLDFDLERKGEFQTTLHNRMPATKAEFNASLVFCDYGMKMPGKLDGPDCRGTSAVLLYASKSLGPLGPNAQTQVSLALQPIVDLLPFQSGGHLQLVVHLEADSPQSSPYVAADALLDPKSSRLQLPLIEYHDPIDQSFERIGSLVLENLDPHEKRVNPGRSAVFRFDVTNGNNHAVQLAADVEGINSGWARITPPTMLEIEGNSKQMVTVVVDMPDDAVDGERADLFLVLEDPNDPAVVALARLRATVVDLTKADITNEAALAGPADTRGSPGLDFTAALLATGILLFWKPRRPPVRANASRRQ